MRAARLLEAALLSSSLAVLLGACGLLNGGLGVDDPAYDDVVECHRSDPDEDNDAGDCTCTSTKTLLGAAAPRVDCPATNDRAHLCCIRTTFEDVVACSCETITCATRDGGSCACGPEEGDDVDVCTGLHCCVTAEHTCVCGFDACVGDDEEVDECRATDVTCNESDDDDLLREAQVDVCSDISTAELEDFE